MRLRLRLWLVLSSWWRARLSLLDESVLTFRVLPNDIDIFRITDDRFLALMDLGRMDLGRMDLVFRNGLLRLMLGRKWGPLASFATIRFRYPLKLFQKYELRTRIIYWDEESFYFQQHFERQGRKVATGYVCATLLGPGGRVRPDDIIAAMPRPGKKPARPEIVSRLQELAATIREQQKQST